VLIVGEDRETLGVGVCGAVSGVESAEGDGWLLCRERLGGSGGDWCQATRARVGVQSGVSGWGLGCRYLRHGGHDAVDRGGGNAG